MLQECHKKLGIDAQDIFSKWKNRLAITLPRTVDVGLGSRKIGKTISHRHELSLNIKHIDPHICVNALSTPDKLDCQECRRVNYSPRQQNSETRSCTAHVRYACYSAILRQRICRADFCHLNGRLQEHNVNRAITGRLGIQCHQLYQQTEVWQTIRVSWQENQCKPHKFLLWINDSVASVALLNKLLDLLDCLESCVPSPVFWRYFAPPAMNNRHSIHPFMYFSFCSLGAITCSFLLRRKRVNARRWRSNTAAACQHCVHLCCSLLLHCTRYLYSFQ